MIANTVTPAPVALDEFESPETFAREVTINGITRTYLVTELSDAASAKAFNTKDAKGNSDPRLLQEFAARGIAACVKREDGTAITFPEARAMRRPLVEALIKQVLAVHGFADDDTTMEDAEKK